MSAFVLLLSILGALLIGAISPGPSFVLVSRIAAGSSRLDGLAAALGMGIGGAVFALLAVFGLSALLMRVEWLYLGLRFVGGLYLAYLGFRIWRGAARPLAPVAAPVLRSPSVSRSLGIGLLTQLSNPKTAVVYASIFAALLPARAPVWLLAALPPAVFLVEAGWYAVVALAFSAPRPRSAYLRSKRSVDRLAGAVMGGLGLRLIAESLPFRR
ncbi:threonine transporter [Aureimonas endophytica]|uniref:Threonine transporter n=1 Tax=Aureimonas endophytica TaxID=2027858 RepID=A0A916ZHE0_9HYPH|nr:LysE family transporter [Aureimonas endophytica]GGD98475.1 threonine transporter [Aureimonas endophytica]